MSHASVAASVREQKEKHPANYCANPRCLWRIVDAKGNPTPCRNHPVPPTVPPAEPPRPCNRCDADTAVRVEVLTSTFRMLVCGACAVELSREYSGDEQFTVRAFAMPQPSCFLTGGGFYSPSVCDVTLRQRDEEQASARYAERVRAVITRDKAVVQGRRFLAVIERMTGASLDNAAD
jgi:hypothetical protein